MPKAVERSFQQFMRAIEFEAEAPKTPETARTPEARGQISDLDVRTPTVTYTRRRHRSARAAAAPELTGKEVRALGSMITGLAG